MGSMSFVTCTQSPLNLFFSPPSRSRIVESCDPFWTLLLRGHCEMTVHGLPELSRESVALGKLIADGSGGTQVQGWA